MKNRIIPFICIVLIYSCRIPQLEEATKDIYAPYYKNCPSLGSRYDTLSGVFFHENYIESYVEDDVITRRGGFVKYGNFNDSLYQRGYFILSSHQLSTYKKKCPELRVNPTSVYELDSIVTLEKWAKMGDMSDPALVNPICRSYYKKYYLNIEFVYLGNISQKVPIMGDCSIYTDYAKRHKGHNYQIKSVPTYLVTRVFDWHK